MHFIEVKQGEPYLTQLTLDQWVRKMKNDQPLTELLLSIKCLIAIERKIVGIFTRP